MPGLGKTSMLRHLPDILEQVAAGRHGQAAAMVREGSFHTVMLDLHHTKLLHTQCAGSADASLLLLAALADSCSFGALMWLFLVIPTPYVGVPPVLDVACRCM